MIEGISAALAGLRAAEQRAGIAAGNIANVRTSGTLQPYGGYVPQVAQQTSNAGGQPQVVSKPLVPSHVAAYDPTHPDADADGLVGAPNVDLATNFVELSIAETAYKANAATLRTLDELSKALFDDKA
jgi:flagellar basal-body rod protein FlgC